MTYDPQGNLTYQRDSLYSQGQLADIQTLHYTYTADNQVASLIRGFGTKEARTTAYSYTPAGKMTTKTLPDGTQLTYRYDSHGFLKNLSSSDGLIKHQFTYNRLGWLLSARDTIHQITLDRELDPFGNILCESFSSGLRIRKEYDAFDRPTRLVLPDQSQVWYTYDPFFLRRIIRASPKGKTLYTHSYPDYDLDGHLRFEILPKQLGPVDHAYDPIGRTTTISSPYFRQDCLYDPCGNLLRSTVDGMECNYTYDGLSQLCSEEGLQTFLYSHDSLHNRVNKDGEDSQLNHFNELLQQGDIRCSYDLNGNLIQRQTQTQTIHFRYDPLHRLTEATTDQKRFVFLYDPLGRRLSKTSYLADNPVDHENYLYDGRQDIGAFTAEGEPKNLRITGPKQDSATVAIELEEQTLIPLLDVQGNIRRLIHLRDGEYASKYDFSAFGEVLEATHDDNPWRFAAKRLDAELGLIYFGKRYYDPQLGRWLTTDPAGFIDSVNLYQYVLNNPFKYRDPHGENVLGFLLGIAEIVVGGAICFTGGMLEVASFGGYTFAFGFHEAAGIALMTHGAAQATYHSRDILPGRRHSHSVQKNAEIYTPDRPLPTDENGVFIPDSDSPHTQLGKKDGKKGKYPKAREFGKDGKPVRDIDFTDHGKGKNHPDPHDCPHQHRWEENSTGGSLKKGDHERVPEWRYP